MKRSRSQDDENSNSVVSVDRGNSSNRTTENPTKSADAGEKRLVQTTIHFGVSNDAHLKKQLAEREAAIEELRQQNLRLEHDNARLNNLMVAVKSQFSSSSENSLSALDHYQEVIRKVMLENAVTSRREARRAVHNLHFELGQILTFQSPTGPRELWVEGNLHRELDRSMSELKEKSRRVQDDLKKIAAGKKSALKTLEPDENSNNLPESHDLEHQSQVLKREDERLKIEMDRTQRQLDELKPRKTAFMKEIRRVHDEDASPFANEATIGENKRYVLISLLGKGGFSEVWKAYDVSAARFVACKIHRISKDWPVQTRSHYLKHAERELDIMKQLKHPRLTELYEVFEYDTETFVSVQELSEGTDLDTFLKRNSCMEEGDARIIMIQLISALRCLAEQEKPIIHFDLKPANILFHSKLQSCLDIKVTDFGLSKVIHERQGEDPAIELTSQGTGTYWYLPPECFETNSTPMVSGKVDIWAAGVIFFQLLYGKRPFAEGESQRRIWQDKLIVSSGHNLEFPANPKVSQGAKDVISKCLAYSPISRIDIFGLCADQYFRKKEKRTKMPPPPPPVSKKVE